MIFFFFIIIFLKEGIVSDLMPMNLDEIFDLLQRLDLMKFALIAGQVKNGLNGLKENGSGRFWKKIYGKP